MDSATQTFIKQETVLVSAIHPSSNAVDLNSESAIADMIGQMSIPEFVAYMAHEIIPERFR